MEVASLPDTVATEGRIRTGGLGPRLRMLVAAVPPCSALGDVGAGDGQVSCRLRAAGVRAIATELHPKAWARLPADVEPRLADGLAAFVDGEVEGVLIAGMGPRSIIRILERRLRFAQGLAWLVLQPQQHPELLEQWIQGRGWAVLARREALQGGRAYRALVVRPEG